MFVLTAEQATIIGNLELSHCWKHLTKNWEITPYGTYIIKLMREPVERQTDIQLVNGSNKGAVGGN